MKTLHLTILTMVVSILVVFSIQNVHAIPYMSPQDLYKQSDMVFYGQVITKQAGPGPAYDYYQVQVKTYFKNPQTSDSITVAGHKPDNKTGLVSYSQFELGDKAIFYISKIDGINTISPYSQKVGDACDVHAFLEPEYFGSLGNYHGGPANNPRLLDVNGNALERILTNQETVLSYDDVWNNYPESRNISVSISIQNEDTGKQIFNKTQNLQVQACSFAGNLKWNFVPTEIGNYIAKIDVDNKTKMSMVFSVIFDSTNSKIILSPLKQFKLGISTMDVKCSIGYVLTIKSEDGSPACVRPLTVKILTKVGWSKFESAQSNHAANAKTNPFGIVGLMYYYGGGPCGVGACLPNTFNLKMNSNYTAYLLGYNICNDNSCITRNNLSILLPLNVIGIPDYKFIALPENAQWKYADVFHIQVEVSSIPDNTTAVWTDLGNSTITH